MFGKKPRVEVPATEKTVFDAAINWESSRILTVEKSERRAWIVAGVAIVVTVLSIAAIAMMMPLKESVPYVIRA